jgi:hypothetical protein
MTKEQIKIAEDLFLRKFNEKGWSLFENRVPHPGGMGILDYNKGRESCAKLNMLKFFSPGEKESVCLSWTDFPDHDLEMPKFAQLNFGFSQLSTEDFDILFLTINNIYK